MRTARLLDEDRSWTFGDVVAALLGVVARNPVLVGGVTAFLVAFSFVSANALWYQPHAHTGTFFATRESPLAGAQAPVEDMTIVIERPETRESRARPDHATGDPALKGVQETLKRLNFYNGEIDGIYGPNTRLAIEAYQNKMGLPETGEVDQRLLEHLGTMSPGEQVLPSPAPREMVMGLEHSASASNSAVRDERLARVQEGLREFGNDAIEVDGLMGVKTRAAILEFQSLFGLPETGDADDAVQSKMKEIGLIR